LQLYADGGYQLRIRSLKGTPNYGPRQIVKLMSQLPIEYSLSSKTVLVLALDFYVYIQQMMMNPLEKQNEFYFDIEGVLFTIHMMIASIERSFLKLKYFFELFKVNNDSREVNGLVILCIKKKLLDDTDLNGISDEFVSQSV
jgi:hypothetical protein